MLRKIIAIKNVGRFRNSAATPLPEFARYTFIVGANGFGKTTLCAVLRSLRENDPSHILGRRTLGTAAPISVELLMSAGSIRFDGATWTSVYPSLAIFDGVFVSENIHSGETVDLDQKRNLYRVIIGDDGLQLAQEEARLATESRATTTEITATVTALKPYHPTLTLDEFLALEPDPAIDRLIVEQQSTVKSSSEAAIVTARPPIAEIQFPGLPLGFEELLSRSLDDIADDAERSVADHLAKHGMSSSDTSWLAEGIDHADDTCPFCGSALAGIPLISAYKALFSYAYKKLAGDLEEARRELRGVLGDAPIGRLNTLAEQNVAAVEFWRQHCTFDQHALVFPQQLRQAAQELGAAAFELLEKKTRAPLETLLVSARFINAKLAFAAAKVAVDEINQGIVRANELISAKKREVAGTDLRMAERELTRRLAIKARHEQPASSLAQRYVTVRDRKESREKQKTEVRGRLDVHTQSVIAPYERRINELLEVFNAEFSITRTAHSFAGGTATSSYQIVVNNVPIDLGDGRTPNDRPSFRNTLSAGDKATLALAFFIAHLERDPDIANKIVVFDDPFSSQDAFRRNQTKHEILKLAARVDQVIVLSHDGGFVKGLWEKAPSNNRAAVMLVDHPQLGSKIQLADLEDMTQGRTATEVDDLQAYLANGAGRPLDIIKKMRIVLEGYLWTTYPSEFVRGADWLGGIAKKIREGGDTHPAAALYTEVNEINDYTSSYHHGENVADATSDQIDSAELKGYCKRTLRVVNASQS